MSDPANPQGKRWFGMFPVEWVLVVLVVSAIVACLLWMSAHDSSKLAYLTGFSDRAEEYSESLPNDEVRGGLSRVSARSQKLLRVFRAGHTPRQPHAFEPGQADPSDRGGGCGF